MSVDKFGRTSGHHHHQNEEWKSKLKYHLSQPTFPPLTSSGSYNMENHRLSNVRAPTMAGDAVNYGVLKDITNKIEKDYGKKIDAVMKKVDYNIQVYGNLIVQFNDVNKLQYDFNNQQRKINDESRRTLEKISEEVRESKESMKKLSREVLESKEAVKKDFEEVFSRIDSLYTEQIKIIDEKIEKLKESIK